MTTLNKYKHKLELPVLSRILGTYTQNIPGPVVISIGGIHGNEPTGIIALRNILSFLNTNKINFSGNFVALVGNLQALYMNVRFIDEDLNRIWTSDQITKLKNDISTNPEILYNSTEQNEQKELYKVLIPFLNSKKKLFFLDLHTTSSKSPPFLDIYDTLENRYFAENFPVPIILGIEEQLEGTFSNFINKVGHISVSFEGGQHENPDSIENHIAAIWIMLASSGCISSSSIPYYNMYLKNLKKSSRKLNKFFEVRQKYNIKKNEDFRMNEGYTNFKRISEGEFVATNQFGKIYTKESGRIFMPLYQKQGEDGFFIVKELNPFIIKISEIFRILKLDSLLHFLPGIIRHSTKKDTLVVNTKILSKKVMNFLHLFGCWREKRIKHIFVVKKRKLKNN